MILVPAVSSCWLRGLGAVSHPVAAGTPTGSGPVARAGARTTVAPLPTGAPTPHRLPPHTYPSTRTPPVRHGWFCWAEHRFQRTSTPTPPPRTARCCAGLDAGCVPRQGFVCNMQATTDHSAGYRAVRRSPEPHPPPRRVGLFPSSQTPAFAATFTDGRFPTRLLCGWFVAEHRTSLTLLLTARQNTDTTNQFGRSGWNNSGRKLWLPRIYSPTRWTVPPRPHFLGRLSNRRFGGPLGGLPLPNHAGGRRQLAWFTDTVLTRWRDWQLPTVATLPDHLPPPPPPLRTGSHRHGPFGSPQTGWFHTQVGRCLPRRRTLGGWPRLRPWF